MVDPERVQRRLRELDRRVGYLRELHGGMPDKSDQIAWQAQVERHLQLAIQCAIDVATHIVADESAETPESYGDAFRAVGNLEVIGDDLAERLASAAGLRNILVHGYLDVDPLQLEVHLDNLDDLETFARAVLARLEVEG